MNPLQPPSDLSLTTPLIHEDAHIGFPRNGDDEFDKRLVHTTAKNDGNYWGGDFVEETRKQLWLAGPLVAVGLSTFSLHIVSLMFVGHLGELPLSGASMATSFAYVTGFSVLLGMAAALETICGQSYGAGQYHMVGIHTQRAMVVLLLLSIPIAIVWANTEKILVSLGQDAKIAAEAGPYAQCMIPSLFAYGLLQCFFRFFQTQNSVFPMVLSSGITTLLHIFVCWTLVFKSGLGGRGAALANTISYWINLLILALYVKLSPSCSKTWTGWSNASLQGIPGFLRLGIPSALMVCLEMWSFEMIVLLSGLLPNPQLETSVLSISLNTTSVVWVIPEGLSGAISTRVANELGAGKPKTARLAVNVVVCTTILETILVGLVLILVRNVWGYAYINETEVVRYLAAMMPLLAAVNCLDGLACVLSGAARGCGWQKIGAYINLASFYIVGLPIAILLAFTMHFGGGSFLDSYVHSPSKSYAFSPSLYEQIGSKRPRKQQIESMNPKFQEMQFSEVILTRKTRLSNQEPSICISYVPRGLCIDDQQLEHEAKLCWV